MPRADGARWQGVTAALQLTPSPELPELRSDLIVPTLDVVTSGVIRPRIRHVRAQALTGALAAVATTGSLRIFPAAGFTYRLLRLHAYVMADTPAAQPREPTYRNLTYADLRLNGPHWSDDNNPVAGARLLGRLTSEEAGFAAAHTQGGVGVTITQPRLSDCFDRLATWTGAGPGQWVGNLLFDQPYDAEQQSLIEFYFRRTPAAADIDRYTFCASFTAAPLGMIPPA